MEHVIKYLFPIFVCGVLPIALVWLIVRMKMNETNRRTQIILAAIEKNAETPSSRSTWPARTSPCG